ncbi:unnamed protein product [Brachionus calyciflorus]|uniref:Uncharacterized protein n=1 Tax=Brachionus calyciflorus TaxID=104777 RepID=A0A813V748_9BILA|nr:unnamed protein product [Brachionus calyciflorus]
MKIKLIFSIILPLIPIIIANYDCPFNNCITSFNNITCNITCDSQTTFENTVSNHSSNKISSIILKNIISLPKNIFYNLEIDYLEIDGTLLTSISDDTFNGVLSLKNLALINFQELSILYDKLDSLEYLTSKLELKSVNIESFNNTDVYILEKLEQLEYLEIKDSNLKQFHINLNGSDWENLKILKLQNNKYLDNLCITGHTITKLKLNNNCLNLINDILIMHNLKELDLSQNSIGYLRIDIFENLTNLNILNLSHNLISTIPNEVFSKLNNLIYLDLSDNLISNLSPDVFQNNFQLNNLILDSNRFDHIPNIKIENLETLSLKFQRSFYFNIQKFAFEILSPISSSKTFQVYLNRNLKLTFDPNAFCSMSSNSIIHLDIVFVGDFCFLRNFNGQKIQINYASSECLYSVDNSNGYFILNAENTTSYLCNMFKPQDNCSLPRLADCDLNKIHLTSIGYDNEINSYRRGKQFCGIGTPDKICLKISVFIIYCEMSNITNGNIYLSVLTDIILSSPENTTRISDLFKDEFENSNEYGVQVKKLNENFIKFYDSVNMLEISVMKYYDFYGIVLKAKGQIYSISSGMLVDGC